MTRRVTTVPAAAKRRRPPWWLWLVLGVAALVGTVAALGGFSDVPVEDLPEIELGQTHEGNETRTTVLGTSLTDTKPGRDFASDDEQFLVLDAEVVNTTDAPTLLTRDLVRVLIPGSISANDGPDMIDPRNGDLINFLQPGLAMRVQLVWTVDAGTLREHDPVIVGIFERYRAVDDPLFDDSYTAPVPVVRIETEIGATA